jgi:Fur family peroxide stress response transcriptional regulator
MTLTPTLSQGEREPEKIGMPESAGTPGSVESAINQSRGRTVGPMDRPTNPEAAAPVDLRSSLEASGRRMTRQRAAVYNHLRGVDHHPTAEDVYNHVKAVLPSISLATVYKALEAFVDSGLATKLVVANDSARYDARGDHHYHLRCLQTGRVEDVPTAFDPDLIAKIDPDLRSTLEARGFKVTGYRLELVGYYKEPPRDPS